MEYFFHTSACPGESRVEAISQPRDVPRSPLCWRCAAQSPAARPTLPPREPPAVAARLATETTFRHAANDSALWLDAQRARAKPPAGLGRRGRARNRRSLRQARGALRNAGGGLHRRSAERPERQRSSDLVIASDQRLGAVRVYALDAPARRITELTAAPIACRRRDHGLVHVSQQPDRQALRVRGDRSGAARAVGAVPARRQSSRAVRAADRCRQGRRALRRRRRRPARCISAKRASASGVSRLSLKPMRRARRSIWSSHAARCTRK